MKIIQSFVTGSQVKVTKGLPPEKSLMTIKSNYAYVQYNTRMKTTFEEKGMNVGEYRRAIAILRRKSKTLDLVELVDKSFGVEDPAYKISFAKTFSEFAEELLVKAVEQFVTPTHLTKVFDKDGLETWIAYNQTHITRVRGKYGEALMVRVAPIMAYRFKGAALKRAKKVVADAERRESKVKKLAAAALKNGERILKAGK
jgi:hypothetical protein